MSKFKALPIIAHNQDTAFKLRKEVNARSNCPSSTLGTGKHNLMQMMS